MKKLFILVFSILIISCDDMGEELKGPRLRVINSGPALVEDLVVCFPNDNVSFGKVPVGTTTGYREVPEGVYSYAAFRYRIDGASGVVPVIDWVGEQPINGKMFTYRVDTPTGSDGMRRIRLVSVRRDQ